MNLPVLCVPEDTIQLVSQSEPVRIRPYLVGEEKLLLIAQQTDEEAEIKKAVKQVITRCTFGLINVETLPSFDIEWLFLQLRSRSVSNMIETNFRCQNKVPKAGVLEQGIPPSEAVMEVCNTLVPVNIDINDIKMVTPAGHTNKVWLNETIGVTLKYPTADIPESQDSTETLISYLDTVFTADGEVSEVSEQTPEEVKAWVDTLSLAHVAKIRRFFDTMPRLSYTFDFKCPKCKYEEAIVLQGILDFFD